MLLWFGTLAVLGVLAMLRHPEVLIALDPRWGLRLLGSQPGLALVIVGAVFLALTGGEALYADMGHFGRRPVRVAWFALVWPALLLNYFGQGALVLSNPRRSPIRSSRSRRRVLLAPLVVLATAATVIASQAVISGAFSITRQAVQLDLLPRVTVRQTSETERGQIYVPRANVFMLIAVAAFVLGLRLLVGAVGRIRRRGRRHDGDHHRARRTGRGAPCGRWPAWRVALLFGCCSSSTPHSWPATSPRSTTAAGCRWCSPRDVQCVRDLARRPPAAARRARAACGADQPSCRSA
jgi:hypothetical protein